MSFPFSKQNYIEILLKMVYLYVFSSFINIFKLDDDNYKKNEIFLIKNSDHYIKRKGTLSLPFSFHLIIDFY
jgi:hypothetical protein